MIINNFSYLVLKAAGGIRAENRVCFYQLNLTLLAIIVSNLYLFNSF